MTPERLRQRALLCLRFAEAGRDDAVATQLKLMAGEYLMEAERLEEGAGLAVPETAPGLAEASQKPEK
jgi:hypothetical protein